MTYPAATVRRAFDLLDEGMSSVEVGRDLGVPDATIRVWNRRRRTGWQPADKPCEASVHDATHRAYAMGCRCPQARAAKRTWQRGWYKSRLLRQERRVPDAGTMRRVQGLMLLGWTRTHIAEAAGLPPETLRSLGRPGQQWVTVDTDRGIRRAERTLVARGQGPSSHTRNRAKKRGYVPLMAWDDIDDPDATPSLGPPPRGGSNRRLPDDPARLAAEVNEASVRVVAERYDVRPSSVHSALARAGYRASSTRDTYDTVTYRKKEAA